MAKTSSLFIHANTLYVGKRSIVQESKRFKIYLPTMFNHLWKELKGKKVNVYIVIDDEDEA